MILGGDGLLGRSVAKSLLKADGSIITTSRRINNVSASCIYLDLNMDLSSWEVPKGVDIVFFCAGVTSMEECQTYPQRTRLINVETTLALANKFAKAGTSVIFPSTNVVFDGQKPCQKPDDSVSPCCEYGRQKADAESGLLAMEENISIVRFAKILYPQMLLINKWIELLEHKQVISPFCDMVVSPISIDFAAKVLIEIAKRKSFGIWQVSGREDITYEELACHIAKKLGAEQECVQAVMACRSRIEFESMPEYSTLDTSRIENELGLSPPDIWSTIDSVFGL